MKKKEYLQHEFNGSFDIAHTKVPVQDKLMQLSTVKMKDGSVVVSSDITLIFNQQRLENKLTAGELREYIQRYTPNKSVYTAQLDDDTLLSTLKSRHIQSLSELRSWSRQQFIITFLCWIMFPLHLTRNILLLRIQICLSLSWILLVCNSGISAVS